jgi:photosystem II stability/assembly factor-like uncharacterized protein
LVIFLLLFFVADSSCIVGDACAQWNNVTPNLLKGADTVSAMQFRDGIVWAGSSNLYSSPDSGKTWLPCVAFPTSHISDISFYDKLRGLVATLDMGFFITTDGGLHWSQEFQKINSSFVKVGYGGSATILLALTIDGQFYESSDGGSNWNPSITAANGVVNSFAIAADGTIYSNNSQSVLGSVSVSSDTGQTWNPKAGTYNNDCWSISVDSCDPNRLYLANEEWQEAGSNSNFYLSTDGGQSWQSTDSHPAPYLSGAMSTTTDGIFLGTRDGSGIHRSMDRGLTWKNIGGPNISPDTRDLATITDNILLAADSAGNIWLTTNGGGDSVQSQPAGTLTLSPNQLFSTDTLACVPIQRAISIVRVGCPAPRFDTAVIVGVDSADYTIGYSAAADSIYVTFLPQKPGANNAVLRAQLNDGTIKTVQLFGFVDTSVGTLSMTPNSLFTSDTLRCDSLIGSVHLSLNGCRPPQLSHIGITGPDMGSYRIVDSTADSISVLWTSQKPGVQQAWLVGTLNNGQRDSVSLNGFSATIPLTYSITPSSLFNSDSIYFACQSATPSKIMLYDTACIWPDVTSEQIVGADSEDYIISNPIASPVAGFDSATILFQPTAPGLRSATYQLTLSNGTVINVPLSGVGLVEHTLTVSAGSATIYADTIGDSVAVPITINGLAHSETVEMVLHYPLPDLVYRGSFDASGTSVDVPGEQWPGRSLLRIPNAEPGIVAAHARFTVFSDTDYEPLISFDSMTVPTATVACEYSVPPVVTTTIIPLEGCGVPTLSHLIHFGALPEFSIQPNPTSSGMIELSSSIDLGDAWIEIYDMLGAKREDVAATILKNAPTMLSLPFESGIYLLHITTADNVSNLRVMIQK